MILDRGEPEDVGVSGVRRFYDLPQPLLDKEGSLCPPP
jgi:hypothetical protein